MSRTGRCYCGAVKYESTGDPIFMAQCHCRECQYITGGAPNTFMAVAKDGFRITQGEPRAFTRADIPAPVTREFCPTCGTHLLTRTPRRPTAVILKVGTLDDPAQFAPSIAIYTCDQQAFHRIPEGVQAFERLPG
jgi:hypothetical protein